MGKEEEAEVHGRTAVAEVTMKRRLGVDVLS